MNFKINCSPHLRMHEITKKLFNNDFHSDVQFLVEGKIIHAHSLELIKRSVVFERQLKDAYGTKRQIKIENFKYDSFYEFIRFIYTDTCEINEHNGIDLLKLATMYNVVLLESQIINSIATVQWILKLFEHCTIANYEVARQQSIDLVLANLNDCLKHRQFLSLHPGAVIRVIQNDQVEQGVTELQILDALLNWINHYCKQHEIQLSTGRQRFDKIIRKIRYPTMSNGEIRDCESKHPGLLREIDHTLTGKLFLFGRNCVVSGLISEPRRDWEYRFEHRKFKRDASFKTKFTVSKDVILSALWVGIEESRNDIEIEISENDTSNSKTEAIRFTQPAPDYWSPMLVTLGESIVLKPNNEYTITIKYLEISQNFISVVCRTKNVKIICGDAEKYIQKLSASDNMLEMLFKSTTK